MAASDAPGMILRCRIAEAFAAAQDFGGGEHPLMAASGAPLTPLVRNRPTLAGTPIRQERAHDFLGRERAARRGIMPARPAGQYLQSLAQALETTS
jgi:hypothetical protein